MTTPLILSTAVGVLFAALLSVLTYVVLGVKPHRGASEKPSSLEAHYAVVAGRAGKLAVIVLGAAVYFRSTATETDIPFLISVAVLDFLVAICGGALWAKAGQTGRGNRLARLYEEAVVHRTQLLAEQEKLRHWTPQQGSGPASPAHPEPLGPPS